MAKTKRGEKVLHGCCCCCWWPPKAYTTTDCNELNYLLWRAQNWFAFEMTPGPKVSEPARCPRFCPLEGAAPFWAGHSHIYGTWQTKITKWNSRLCTLHVNLRVGKIEFRCDVLIFQVWFENYLEAIRKPRGYFVLNCCYIYNARDWCWKVFPLSEAQPGSIRNQISWLDQFWSVW